MVVPLMFYLGSTVERRMIKWGLGAAALLSMVAVLGSQSRGALLAVGAMSVFLWLKAPQQDRLRVDPVRESRVGHHVHAGRVGDPDEVDRELRGGRVGDGAHQLLDDGV
mgnify:CR=1 FL=1